MVSEAFKSLNTMSNKEVLILVVVEDGLRASMAVTIN